MLKVLYNQNDDKIRVILPVSEEIFQDKKLSIECSRETMTNIMTYIVILHQCIRSNNDNAFQAMQSLVSLLKRSDITS